MPIVTVNYAMLCYATVGRPQLGPAHSLGPVNSFMNYNLILEAGEGRGDDQED